jgi:hypothetical protein
LSKDFVETVVETQRLFHLNLHVHRGAARASRDLVAHDARFRQRHALALGARGQEERTHRARLTHAEGDDVGLDEVHRVIDGQPRSDRTTRRIDVDVDILLSILAFQVEKLSHDGRRHVVVEIRAQHDDALAKQARIDVEAAFAATVLLNHVGDEA